MTRPDAVRRPSGAGPPENLPRIVTVPLPEPGDAIEVSPRHPGQVVGIRRSMSRLWLVGEDVRCHKLWIPA